MKIKSPEDRIRQAQAEIDAALAKRNYGYKLLNEAEEEMAVARLKLSEAQKDAKIQEPKERKVSQ